MEADRRQAREWTSQRQILMVYVALANLLSAIKFKKFLLVIFS